MTCHGTGLTLVDVEWLSDDEQRTWRAYLRLQSRLSAHLNRQLLADSHLSLADYDVLVALTDVPDGRLRVGDLARAVDWEQSRLSHHLSRMQRRDLVVRDDCVADRRGAYIIVTPAGRHAIEEAAPRHVQTVRDLVFDAMTPAEAIALRLIAEGILARLEATG
jgi:DNA-binding MarR family transcriptional regulator